MKIYDCFAFFNELDLLEIRLNELYEVIDYFVIVEAEKTHQNELKKIFYLEHKDDERFKKFSDKIIHVVVKSEEFNNDTWHNERLQFSSIVRGIESANPEDLIIVGAADEIPNRDTVINLKNSSPENIQYLNLTFNYFYLDTRYYNEHGNNTNWVGNCVAKKKYIYDNLYVIFMNRYSTTNVIQNAGWHFSFMGNSEHVLKKINSYAHNEYKYLTLPEIETFISNLTDPLGRDNLKFYKHEQIDNLPIFVKNNMEKFRKNIHQNF
jgi:beta-1,4-mannosyl-glycoprotein beta-1,4-N-acetylglucosaminyltransferase